MSQNVVETPNFTLEQQRRIKFIDELARVAYTVSRSYMLKNGDPHLPLWADMDYLDSEYAREGVEIYLAKPNGGPEIWHQQWFEQHQQLGWKHGKAHNPVKKTSPVFVPFDRLPPAKRNSDIIFHATVRALTNTETREYHD